MPPSDPWLSRQNAALKLIGHGVTLDVAGARVRLRATMRPRPTDPPGAEPRQHRISTVLAYPDQASEARQLAEQLGNALNRHRLGVETFDWTPWLPKGRQRPAPLQEPTEEPQGVSGRQAIRRTREWWGKQRRRGPSADDSWKVDYEAPLAPLQAINALEAGHLVALVEATTAGSRSRRRASQAAATVARALDWPEELVSQLRELGKGYSAARSQSPRELPRDEEIEALIDRLSHRWQWPVAVAATYGCRPHEALLFAEVQLPGDTEIHGTGPPQGCQVRRLRLRRGQCRGFRNMRLWADGSHTANLLLAHPTGLAVEEPWYLISNAAPSLAPFWSYV